MVCKKTRVLTFVGHYLPGFKSGGILRSVQNTVSRLHSELEFLIVTRDHDVGDKIPYPDVKRDQWQVVGNSEVYYLGSGSASFGRICELINNTPHDVIHLNSFFDPLTVKVLFGKKTGKITANTPVILSPRGEFAWASLKIKFLKKLVYISVSRFFRFFDEIVWHASSEHEKEDIINVMNVGSERIRIAKDIAISTPYDECEHNSVARGAEEPLRIIFLSRISPEKNLDYALRVLSQVHANITFDIYGIIENAPYWEKCRRYIDNLPDNISVSYRGPVDPALVVKTFSAYDLFFFPSGGENYGHVIAESLAAGTQVLISRNTPWRDLKDRGFGWDVDLKDTNLFVEVIDSTARMSRDQLRVRRTNIRKVIKDVLFNTKDVEDNRQLFLQPLDSQ